MIWEFFFVITLIGLAIFMFYQHSKHRNREKFIDRSVKCYNFYPNLANGHSEGLEQGVRRVGKDRIIVKFYPTDGKDNEDVKEQEIGMPEYYRFASPKGGWLKDQTAVFYFGDDWSKVPKEILDSPLGKIFKNGAENITMLKEFKEFSKTRQSSNLESMKKMGKGLSKEEIKQFMEIQRQMSEDKTSDLGKPKPIRKLP